MTAAARGRGRRFAAAFFARVDPFLLAMIATVALASLFPATGAALPVAKGASTVAISLLFFLSGIRLSTSEALAGLKHWRLHLFVVVTSFVIFPLLGFALRVFEPWLLAPGLYVGVMFLSTLPSTVQSSIAFTSIGGGNVGAAVCSASLSNILGVVVSPLLITVFLGKGAAISPGEVLSLVGQILVPFVVGQLLRRWLFPVVKRFPLVAKGVDRGSILLVVYAAFSESVTSGIWRELSLPAIGGVLVVDALLLAAVLCLTWFGSRLLGFTLADRVAITFCGSKKSLTTGVPIAAVQFAGPALGLTIFPLMIFHQLQIFVCASIARRWARLAAEEAARAAGSVGSVGSASVGSAGSAGSPGSVLPSSS